MDLKTICELWDLQSATQCLSGMIASAGEAGTWPPVLIHQLARLARNTQDKYAIAMHALMHVRRLRLVRYPESNPDVIAQDVKIVYKRMAFLRKHNILDGRDKHLEVAAPRLDAFSSPPSWRNQRRAVLDDKCRGDEMKDRRVDKGRGPAKVQTQSSLPLSPRYKQEHVGESSRTGINSTETAPAQTPSPHTTPQHDRAFSSRPGSANDADVESGIETPTRYVEMGDLPASSSTLDTSTEIEGAAPAGSRTG
jgi:hypothetical protein